MRKLLLTALVAVSFISSSFAGTVSVNHFIRNNFEAEFKAAKNVEWTSSTSYVTATFLLNKQKTQAFYEPSGDLIGTAHTIDIESLPTYAKRTFAKKYANYTVQEVIEFIKPDASAYFVSASAEGENVILMIADGQVSRYK
jgi:hypothetical protein